MVKLVNQPLPHLRSKNSTFKMMMEFLGACVVLWLTAIIFYACSDNFLTDAQIEARQFYGWYYALKAFGMGFIGMLFAVLADAIFYLPIFWVDEKRAGLAKGESRVKAYLSKLVFNYSYVSGLLIALLLPVGTPVYVLCITSFGAIFVFKNLFGGFGGNIFNPAIIGRIFAQVCFGGQLKTIIPISWAPQVDLTIQTGASVTTNLFSGVDVFQINQSITEISTLDLFLGKYFGTLGETFALVLIIIGVYLCVRKIIDWRVPTFYIGTIFVTYLIMALCQGMRGDSFEFAFRSIMAGGILFGGILCLTDPVTSPVNRTGKIIFATGAAFITLMIRFFASAPEGVAFSILIMNMLVPLIDRAIYARTNKGMTKKYVAISVLPVASLLFGISFGAMNRLGYSTTGYHGFNRMVLNNNFNEDSFKKIKIEDRSIKDQVLFLSEFEYINPLHDSDSKVGYYANLRTKGAVWGDITFSATFFEKDGNILLNNMYLIDDSELKTETNALYDQIISSIFYTKPNTQRTNVSKFDTSKELVILGSNALDLITGATSTDTLPAMHSALVEACKLIDPTNKEATNPGLKALIGDNFNPESITSIESDNENVLKVDSFDFNTPIEGSTSSKGYYVQVKTSDTDWGNVEFSAILYEKDEDLVLYQMYLIDDSNLNTSGNALYQQIINQIFDMTTRLSKYDSTSGLIISEGEKKPGDIITGATSVDTLPAMYNALAQAVAVIKG